MTKVIKRQTLLAYVAEVTPGTTPATPTFKKVRVNGETLEVGRKMVFSTELDGLRAEKNFAIAQRFGAGGVTFELTATTLEDFIAAACRDAWAANVVKGGAANTVSAFTLEALYEAGGTDVYKRLTGAEVDTFSLAIKAGEIVSGSCSFMARDSDFASAGVAGATYTAINTEPIQVGANIASLAMSGLTIDCVPELTLEIKNNLRQQVGLGNLALCGIGADKFEVSGKLTAILDSTEQSVLTAYSDGTATSLSFNLGPTANKKLTVSCPNIVLENIAVQADGVDGDVMISADWRALQAASLSGASIQITRNVA